MYLLENEKSNESELFTFNHFFPRFKLAMKSLLGTIFDVIDLAYKIYFQRKINDLKVNIRKTQFSFAMF